MEIDLTRVPRGEMAARTLVEALAQTDDRAERHFLEIKSAIDLKSKEGIAKVAKFILGAANRMPDVAARYFEGHAVMVLGVGAGSTPGIQPVEALDIERGVRPYLSVNGPRWDLQRVSVDDGREVLLVIVDPPKSDQPAFPCFKDGPGLNNGQIIVRGDGETRQATGEEVLLLQQRGLLGGRPGVDLDVAVEGVAMAYSCDASVLEGYIERETARLMSVRTASDSPNPYAVASARALDVLGQKRENRTSEQYERQITDWEAECRASWASAMDTVAATFGPTVSISVSNRQESFLEDVELKIHLEGPVRGLEREGKDDFDPDSLLPRPPRAWGPWMDTSRFLVPGLSREFSYIPSMPSIRGPVSFRNGGSVTIDVQVGDLRPRETYTTHDDEMVLVVDEAGLTELTGTWKITVRGHHAVYQGPLNVPVVTRDITDVMQRLVGEDVDGDEADAEDEED